MLARVSDRPLVSLVMPAWRPKREWLRTAVISALSQRGCELEVLVVDDGSPERVAGLLARTSDPRLRVIEAPHGGASRARNAGVGAARGELIRFVDADDAFERDSTARLIRLIGNDPSVVAYGATMFCDEELRPIWKMTSSLEGEISEDVLLGRFTVRPQSLLFPRSLVEAAGGWDESFGVSEDWDFVLRVLERGRARGEHEVATYYRKHSSSLTADRADGRGAARRVVDAYFQRHPDQRGTRLERLARARLEATAARVDATHGRPLRASRSLARALSLDPGAVATEIRQSLPALRGHMRRAISRPTSDAPNAPVA
jgi:glycosyltransferase involved in cell wall biosynthesis